MTEFRIVTTDRDGRIIGHTYRDDPMAALLEVGSELRSREQHGTTIFVELLPTPTTT